MQLTFLQAPSTLEIVLFVLLGIVVIIWVANSIYKMKYGKGFIGKKKKKKKENEDEDEEWNKKTNEKI